MATIKQKRAIKELALNGGNISKAMLAAGYTAEVSKHTDKLTGTKGFQELMNEYLPDEDLAKIHKEGLHAYRVHSSMTEPDRLVEDFAVRHKYLDLAYRVKKKIDNPEETTKIMILRLDA